MTVPEFWVENAVNAIANHSTCFSEAMCDRLNSHSAIPSQN